MTQTLKSQGWGWAVCFTLWYTPFLTKTLMCWYSYHVWIKIVGLWGPANLLWFKNSLQEEIKTHYVYMHDQFSRIDHMMVGFVQYCFLTFKRLLVTNDWMESLKQLKSITSELLVVAAIILVRCSSSSYLCCACDSLIVILHTWRFLFLYYARRPWGHQRLSLGSHHDAKPCIVSVVLW